MIVKYNDYLSNLKGLIDNVKYQKVLLIYSSEATDSDIAEIYDTIKDNVVFNKVQYESLDKDIINNGYRMVILLCSGDDILHLDYSVEDVINVYIPLDNGILPFFYLLRRNSYNQNNYILIRDHKADICLNAHIEFLKFWLDILSLKHNTEHLWLEGYSLLDLRQSIDIISNITVDNYIDVDIVSRCSLLYQDLVCVELVVLDGYLRLIQDAKLGNLTMIDIYKYHFDDVENVDMYYKVYQDSSFIQYLSLNHDVLIERILGVKDKLKEYLTIISSENTNIDTIIESVKEYSKANEELAELYLYDVFR